MKELELRWKSEDPIKMYRNLRMPQYEINRIRPSICQESFYIGNYSCLVAEFSMQRSIGFYLVQLYLPTILIVVISWVSFWMDVDSVPGRTTLGVTTLLTVSTKSSDIQEGLPQVSYVKAIDVWMGACTAFVFCALLEFTLVNYMWRKRPQPKVPGLFGMGGGRVGGRPAGDICTSCKEKKGSEGSDAAIFPPPGIAMANKTMTDEALAALPLQLVASLASNNSRRVQAIDSNCRVLFPLSFVFFNVIYWCYYLL
ncbi:Neurotransmitter-gated ion-channel transmembrane domain [Trinorchestia longiramus]|nr:Neurotransmitter-gated ion-channel transmembrane domain [Trinorchestia longiramus]